MIPTNTYAFVAQACCGLVLTMLSRLFDISTVADGFAALQARAQAAIDVVGRRYPWRRLGYCSLPPAIAEGQRRIRRSEVHNCHQLEQAGVSYWGLSRRRTSCDKALSSKSSCQSIAILRRLFTTAASADIRPLP